MAKKRHLILCLLINMLSRDLCFLLGTNLEICGLISVSTFSQTGQTRSDMELLEKGTEDKDQILWDFFSKYVVCTY